MVSVEFNKEASAEAELKEKLHVVLNPENSVVPIYEKWASVYEKDKKKSPWKSYEGLAHKIKEFVSDKKAKILDVGAGTVLHGMELQRHGFTNMDAIDPSSSMLQKARERKLYNRYIVGYVGKKRLDIEDNTYDVISGAGVFVPNHIDSDAFDELHRIAKAGGLIFIWTGKSYYGEEYKYYGEKLDAGIKQFVEKALWILESREMVPYHGRVFLLSVLRKR